MSVEPHCCLLIMWNSKWLFWKCQNSPFWLDAGFSSSRQTDWQPGVTSQSNWTEEHRREYQINYHESWHWLRLKAEWMHRNLKCGHLDRLADGETMKRLMSSGSWYLCGKISAWVWLRSFKDLINNRSPLMTQHGGSERNVLDNKRGFWFGFNSKSFSQANDIINFWSQDNDS